MDLTVQGGQSPASYMESAADWPPPISRVSRKPKVAQFCAAPWPNFTPPLTPTPATNINAAQGRLCAFNTHKSENRHTRAGLSPEPFASRDQARRENQFRGATVDVRFDQGPQGAQASLFARPNALIEARTLDEVAPALDALDAARNKGKWIAGRRLLRMAQGDVAKARP
ncbi:hypothetical protein [Rhodobacter xanthinilyticus]|uniref:hypothetical protein n=1 Tax=Rhodobacter xanthinilyticus TaxID=1850250 RepID=UPI0012EC043F|nr:hypothetical protein [Rhodobacter xanthinilyticus]